MPRFVLIFYYAYPKKAHSPLKFLVPSLCQVNVVSGCVKHCSTCLFWYSLRRYTLIASCNELNIHQDAMHTRWSGLTTAVCPKLLWQYKLNASAVNFVICFIDCYLFTVSCYWPQHVPTLCNILNIHVHCCSIAELLTDIIEWLTVLTLEPLSYELFFPCVNQVERYAISNAPERLTSGDVSHQMLRNQDVN